MARWTLIFWSSIWFVGPAFGQRAKPGDFPWRFRMLVSNDSESFYGALKFDIFFDSRSDHHQTFVLPTQTFEPGSVISSLEKLSEGGMADNLARVDISVIGNPKNCTLESLVIKEFSLTSFHKRLSFLKIFNNEDALVLSQACGNSSGISNHSGGNVSVEGFKSIPSKDCYYQSEFYESNQSFEIGCEMKCRCRDGMVDCDSMCKPPSVPLPRNCRFASIDRKCCDESECMEDALWDSCPVHTAARDRMPPWTVTLTLPQGRNQSEERRTCGASIIHKKLLITSAHCVRSGLYGTDPVDPPSSIAVIHWTSNGSSIARIKSIHIHPAYTGKDASSDLALIELAQEGIVFGDTIKRVNLPWPTLCKRYVISGCAIQYTSVDSFDSYVGSVVSSGKFCSLPDSGSVSQQKSLGKPDSNNGTEPLICIQRLTEGLPAKSQGLASKKCNQENGNGVVTKRAQYHYIVGVTAHQYKTKPNSLYPKTEALVDQIKQSVQADPIRTRRTDQAANSLDQQPNKEGGTSEEWRSCGREFIPVTNLCPHIDWLKNTINEILARE